VGEEGRNEPNIVCTYELKKKVFKILNSRIMAFKVIPKLGH
jgi:hypothetical protein